jgi:hypothetical protein
MEGELIAHTPPPAVLVMVSVPVRHIPLLPDLLEITPATGSGFTVIGQVARAVPHELVTA